MRDQAEEVHQYLSRAVAEWRQLGAGPPWSRLGEEERMDFLPPLLEATLRGTICEPPDDRARADAVRAAAIHGAERRRQAFTEEEVLQEHYLLRLALWSAVRNGDTFRLRARSLARADVLFSTLILATLRGFRREEIDADEAWAGMLDDLLAEG
jgi:hypothetical protein